MLLKQSILIIALVMSIGIFSDAEAQQTAEDVVYLKGGSMIRGIIVEQIPNKSLRIRTQGGVEITFKMSDVLKITKVLPMRETDSFKKKSSVRAFTLSFLSFGCGYGQVYNEQYAKAFGHLVVTGACLGIMLTGFDGSNGSEDNGEVEDNGGSSVSAYLGLLLGIGNWAYSTFDAYSSAKKINEQNRQQQSVSQLLNRLRNRQAYAIGQRKLVDSLMLAPYISSDRSGAMLSFRF